MQRFLVQLPHDPNLVACARVVQVFLSTGSHLLSHADWGCKDGDHTAWLIVDADSREEARLMVPPPFRASAKITALNKFTMDEVNDILEQHQTAP